MNVPSSHKSVVQAASLDGPERLGHGNSEALAAPVADLPARGHAPAKAGGAGGETRTHTPEGTGF